MEEAISVKASDAGGLEAELELAVGARVMIRKNIDNSKGVVNGAEGIIKELEMSPVIRGKSEVIAVHVQFQNSVERITRTKTTFKVKKQGSVKWSREQFPLILSYGITVHKSQVYEFFL